MMLWGNKLFLKKVVIILSLAILTGCDTGADVVWHFVKADPELPEYIVPIVIVEKDDPTMAMALANAIVVDWKNGFLISNAHVVQRGFENDGKFKVRIFDDWYGVETKEEWINWQADLAILKMDTKRFKGAVKEAELAHHFSVFNEAEISAYIHDKDGDNFTRSRVVRTKLMGFPSEYGVTISSKVEVLRLLVAMKIDGYKPKKGEIRMLYDK